MPETVALVEYERMRRVADEQHAKLMAALLEVERLRAEAVPRSALEQVGVLGGASYVDQPVYVLRETP
jgi:aspartate/glutamate racemase